MCLTEEPDADLQRQQLSEHAVLHAAPPPSPPPVVFPEALAQDVADDCKLVLMISRSDRISTTLSAGDATPDQSPCKCSIDFYSAHAAALILPSFLPLAKASITVCGSRRIII